eukprot:EG_transcript_15662
MHAVTVWIVVCLLLPCSPKPFPLSDLSAAELAGNASHMPFARVHGTLSPQQWKAAACPLEGTSFSCYWHNFTRGWEAEHRPIPGAKRLFSLATFEELVRCRDLVFIGDSLAGQFWQTVACLMRRPDTQFSPVWIKIWPRRLCPFGTLHCALKGGCATFPHLSSRVCFYLDNWLHFGPSQFGLQKDSILVVNTAFHHKDSKSLINSLYSFTTDYSQISSPSRPILVWAEAPPQHFPGHPSGYYQGKHMNYTRCAPVDREKGYAHDWRNRIAERHMRAMGIPVLRRWNETISLWDFHVVHSGRTDADAEAVDCTHYCLPSAPTLWAVALMDLLESLIVPKGAACRSQKQSIPLPPLLFPQEKERKRNKYKKK